MKLSAAIWLVQDGAAAHALASFEEVRVFTPGDDPALLAGKLVIPVRSGNSHADYEWQFQVADTLAEPLDRGEPHADVRDCDLIAEELGKRPESEDPETHFMGFAWDDARFAVVRGLDQVASRQGPPQGLELTFARICAEPEACEGGFDARCVHCKSTTRTAHYRVEDGKPTLSCDNGCHPESIIETAVGMVLHDCKLPPVPPAPGRLFSEIPKSGPVAWLWTPRIPLGKLTLIEGEGEKGKSAVLIDLAARITTGRRMPLDDKKREPVGVVWIGYEDGSDILRGRLEAAGADLSRVLDLSTVSSSSGEAPLSLPRDLPTLEAGIARVGAVLIVLDPIMGALDGKTDSNSDASIRRVLTPLAALADKTKTAVAAIRHWGKDGGRKASHRGGGSVAFLSAARAVWAFLVCPEDSERFVMARVKGNLAKKPPGVTFRLVDAGGHPVVEYLGLETRTADEILDTPRKAASSGAIVAWLHEALRDGPLPSETVIARGKDAGFSRNQLFDAKPVAGIRARKAGMTGGWTWELEDKSETPF